MDDLTSAFDPRYDQPNIYEQVNKLWGSPLNVPPITREEAQRAARKLYRHFGPTAACRAHRPVVRKVWVSLMPGNSGSLRRGWRRLVHDVSHRVFRYDHFKLYKGQHGDNHAKLELAMAQYVIAQGWLEGKLKSKPKTELKLTRSEKLARVDAAIKRWETKYKRAETALKKLQLKRCRVAKLIKEIAA
jgi:hypothetical protein